MSQSQPTANRRDLIVVHTTRRAYGMPDWDEFRVGVVTNITRENRVKRWQLAGATTTHALPPYAHVYIVASSKIDVEAVLKTAAAHAWPSGGAMPYESLREVRAALRPHWTEKP